VVLCIVVAMTSIDTHTHIPFSVRRTGQNPVLSPVKLFHPVLEQSVFLSCVWDFKNVCYMVNVPGAFIPHVLFSLIKKEIFMFIHTFYVCKIYLGNFLWAIVIL
jgi:hypothetical protein